MDSGYRRRLPGIVRRDALLPAEPENGTFRAIAGRIELARPPQDRGPELSAVPVEMPTPRGRKSLEAQIRRAFDLVTPYAEAVWSHLRVHWTDAFIALGFVAVVLLSAYLLLRP